MQILEQSVTSFSRTAQPRSRATQQRLALPTSLSDDQGSPYAARHLGDGNPQLNKS